MTNGSLLRPVRPAPRSSLGRNVIALSVVSFLTDVSSDMIYPLLPVFLTSVLGASASFVGAIEGAAESTAALLKLASGWWSDRVERRKPLVVFGYAIAALTRPLIALTRSAGQVLVIRVADRIGKGIRSSPRDALIADTVDPAIRGRAFGFQRAWDNAGAVVGPLLAFLLLRGFHVQLRTVFWLAAIPGILAVITVIVGVREARRDTTAVPNARLQSTASLPRQFWAFLVVIFVFTLGNSTDAFLLLRASQLGVPVAIAPVLWAAFHVVKSATGTPGGALSDRIGRKKTLLAGWLLYAVVYFAFGAARAEWHVWALFAVYGVYFGLTEGTERALVADIVPAERRGAAYGWYYLAISLGALPASVIFGVLWDRAGAEVAFRIGATLALVASIGLLLLPTPSAAKRST